MVKIKVNKKMNLSELVQYINEKKRTNGTFLSTDGNIVEVNRDGSINTFRVKPYDSFEVAVEEEVTEDTVIPLLLEVSDIFDEGNLIAHTSKDTRISDMYDSRSIAFHMVNPDGTTTLLWTKEGGAVE